MDSTYSTIQYIIRVSFYLLWKVKKQKYFYSKSILAQIFSWTKNANYDICGLREKVQNLNSSVTYFFLFESSGPHKIIFVDVQWNPL